MDSATARTDAHLLAGLFQGLPGAVARPNLVHYGVHNVERAESSAALKLKSQPLFNLFRRQPSSEKGVS
jgi:hypothetical protein